MTDRSIQRLLTWDAGQWFWIIKSSDFPYICLGEAPIWTPVARSCQHGVSSLMCHRTACNTLSFPAHPHPQSLLLMIEGKLSISQMAMRNWSMACGNRSWKDRDLKRALIPRRGYCRATAVMSSKHGKGRTLTQKGKGLNSGIMLSALLAPFETQSRE